MPGEAIQIGPFVGGLNTFSDATAIADNELAVCENFELDLDGSLVSRPPFADTGITFPLQSTGNINVLGYYYGPGSVPYLLASDGVSKTYYFNGTSWTLITDTFAGSAMTQFDNKAWIIAPFGSSNPGGYWTPAGGFVADTNMPKGDTIVAHKFRLWVSGGRDALNNPTRLYYSNTLSSPLGLWTASPDFQDVGAGDGQSIVRVSVYYNSLVVFRTNSIWSFQFTSDPDNGVQSLLVPNIGLASKNALVAWENYIYFIHDDKAYEFVNNRASQINLKVPLASTDRTGVFDPYIVSLFSNRVIFSFWGVLFVFSIRTRTWTIWKSSTHGAIGAVIAPITDTDTEDATVFSSAIVPAGGTRTAKTLKITDAVTTNSEEFVCRIQTKNYNYQTSSAYKRLFWWGIDAIFNGTVTATAVPITWNQSVFWNNMHSYTWAQVSSFDWNQPANPGSDVQTVRTTTGVGSIRKFVKFLKALRFRQIHYLLEFQTDGSTESAPVRLFALMTYVKAHEKVSKTVT